MRALTCSRSASCSTSWRAASGPFAGADVRRHRLTRSCTTRPPPLASVTRRRAGRSRAHRRAGVSRRSRASASRRRSMSRTSCGGCARSWSAIEPGAAARTAARKVASIAVLPFANRSASADDEYFSDGLADELLNVLAKIKGLRVTARTSSFHFKGKDTTVAEIGRALDVATCSRAAYARPATGCGSACSW